MVTKEEYCKQKNVIMQMYRDEAKKLLLACSKDKKYVEMIPFFADGVCNPEVWFDDRNDFRPLFIMKEVSIGETDLKDFYDKWKTNYFDHAEDPFGDIQIGINIFKNPPRRGNNNPWKRIMKLAKGLEIVYREGECCDYYDKRVDSFSFEEGGRANTNNTSNDSNYDYQTANELYLEIVKKIAVINIKKIGGGTTAYSKFSEKTINYLEYLKSPFSELLLEQIELINPTVIVFCSPEISTAMERVYGDRIFNNYICINGYHPTRNTNSRFYKGPIKEYYSRLYT